MNFNTHCALRLGDNLQHLQFLRKMAHKYPQHHFTHYAHRAYLPQLIEVIADLRNIQLADLDEAAKPNANYWEAEPADVLSVNVWKNADGQWERAENRNDYVGYYLDFFSGLALGWGLESPMRDARDFLFDYPALAPSVSNSRFDFMVINSPPKSGQAQGMNIGELNRLAELLHENGHRVLTVEPTGAAAIPSTRPLGLTVSQIGALSNSVDNLIAVSTGPSWPTFNVWNSDTINFRALIIERERVDILPDTLHCKTVADVRAALIEKGFI